ncbi:MAG TPA: hypothetical protein RMH99_04925 [Sandaracinaceae bacterium LLY-WYZ-13_1]|nr:hypothetical protein [Sandaracinaceae bacterium LLY-WYZ-13_1]
MSDDGFAWAERFEPWAGGDKAGVGALADEALAKRLRNYKRQVAKRYRVVDPEATERLLSGGPYWISTKLDGELWFLVKRGGEVALCAYNGRVVRGTPLAREAERLLADAPDLILAGELIAQPRTDTGRARVHHVATALGEAELEGQLSFHAFDLVEDDGRDALLSAYEPRLERMRALLEGGERITVVETVEGDTPDVVRLFREWVVSDRFEGLVVRSERGLTYKIKSTLTIDAVVIAYGERITGDVHQVREMSVALRRDDGTWQLLGAVGNGFSEQDRAAWHQRLSAMEVPSRFRLANREGTLSKFVRPEVVVEIRCSDLLASDSWDAPIRRMSLRYDEATGWEPVAETPTAVMIHPIFLRERTDKAPDAENVGMTQVTSYVPLATPSAEAVKREQRPAEVVRRAVFTKTTKDKTAVRKYAIVDTHKAGERSYPALVVYFTDYSPGRKEPLQTALRTASTMAKAEAQVVDWLGSKIKRGWGEVEDARLGEPVEPPAEAAAVLAKAREKAAKA